jgi:hypothetical protein
MKDFFLKVAATVLAAAIVATASALWKMNERLARIETVLSIKNQTASK